MTRLFVGPCPTMLATLCPTHPLNQSCGPSTKRCCFFRYPFTLSSHCSQVYPHSHFICSFLSLLHVHPSVALCFVSTVLLVLLLLLMLVIGRLHSLVAPSSLLLHDLLPFLSPHDQYVLLANIRSSACASPLYHLVSLHPAKGFAS